MIALIFATLAFANSIDDAIPKDCNPADWHGYNITRKFTKDKYEMFAANAAYPLAVLITTTSEFGSNGPAFVNVRFMGSKELKLENGFSQRVGIFKECKK